MFRRFKFDKQFLFFCMQDVLIGIFAMIDVAFGNNIGIDSICVLSAFTVVGWCTYCTYCIGNYAYRFVLKDAKMCFLISLISSVITGILLYTLASPVAHLYSLTEPQYELLERCLKIHALSCPVLSVRESLGNYAEYKCCNKQAAIGNVILYSSMILTDALTVMLGGDVADLLACTALCSSVYIVYEVFALDMRREELGFSWRRFKKLWVYGLSVWIDRAAGKVATVFYNIYASKLGTHDYSIHAVCYAVSVFTENFTNGLYTYQTVSLSKVSASHHKLERCKKVILKYSAFIIFGAYFTAYILLMFTHGDVSIKECADWTALYCSYIAALIVYESMKGYLTSEKLNKYLIFGGFFGILIRIPAVLLGYYMGLGLVTFAISTFLDFGARAIFYYTVSVWHDDRLLCKKFFL